MSARPVLRFPDARLKLVAASVELFDSSLAALSADLVDTMRAAPGVGITAPHVGVPLRLVVLELVGDLAPRIYVNPSISWASPETETHLEGSVSMPGVTETVMRSRTVQVSYSDLDGKACTEEAAGFRAACHQHEIDQLDGIFWIQRLSALKRERIVTKFRKLGRRG